MILSRYYYWSFIELVMFVSVAESIMIHLLMHQLSPCKVYMYGLMAVSKGANPSEIWSDEKRSQ